MSDYTKQLEEQIEDLKSKLANAELLQDIEKFINREINKIRISPKTIKDIKEMKLARGIDLKDSIRSLVIDTIAEDFDEKFGNIL